MESLPFKTLNIFGDKRTLEYIHIIILFVVLSRKMLKTPLHV